MNLQAFGEIKNVTYVTHERTNFKVVFCVISDKKYGFYERLILLNHKKVLLMHT